MQLFKSMLIVAAACSLPAAAQEAADTTGYNRFRIGGYGEVVASVKNYGINRFMVNGSERRTRATVAIPRTVLGLDYKFTSKWIFGMEIEFESGGTGSSVELESSENGEYETEMERGGEVALEQLHITRLIIPEFNVRAGHLILPVGLTNAHHEPINFFGTSRPEAESCMLPTTWHETGVELFGTIGRFNYQFMLTAGLNANGFDRDEWVAPGRQGLFETDNFTSPAYTFRLDYTGVKGLRTGASVYYCHNTGANADKAQHYAAYSRIPVTILTWDAQFRNRYVTARANIVWGHLGNSAAVNDRNGRLPNASPYSRLTPVASSVVSYGAEAGVNLRALAGVEKIPVIYPYVRYEYFNPQFRVEAPLTADNRLEVSKWSAGVNWFALPNLVVKADYCHRMVGTSNPFGPGRYNAEGEFSIGLAYIGWFFKN